MYNGALGQIFKRRPLGQKNGENNPLVAKAAQSLCAEQGELSKWVSHHSPLLPPTSKCPHPPLHPCSWAEMEF